jgi:hypothetical protein
MTRSVKRIGAWRAERGDDPLAVRGKLAGREG